MLTKSLSLWIVALSFASSFVGSVVGDSTLLIASDGDISFLVDLGERRVEGLRIGIVEGARGTIVLTGNHDQRLHIWVLYEAGLLTLGVMGADSGHITDLLLSCLFGLDSRLDREVVLALIAGMETPIGTFLLSLLSPVFLSLATHAIFPCNTSAQVVPVDITIDGNESECAPEDPTHFADHPSVGLAHVVCDMEHHFVV